MAKLKEASVDTTLTVVLELTEAEVRALDGMFGYSAENFLAAFYEKMGKAYVQPYEEGVRSLHRTIRSAMSGPIAKVDAARRLLSQNTNQKTK